jgi:hypothetical protein
MGKNAIVALSLIVAINIASTAFAAPNPFADVPAKHWAYDAVSELSKAGIIDGYGDKTFRGEKTMTRYEMAQLVANAMTKADKADAQVQATINKLAMEFAAELNKLDARVDKLEKKAGKIVFDGETLFEYAKLDSDAHSGSKAFEWRQRLHMNAKFNDQIDYFARIQAGNKMGETGAGNNAMAFTRAGINIRDLVGKDSVLTVGRQPLAIGRGFAFADTDNNDGVLLKNKLGKALVTSYYLSEATETDVKGINVDYTANDQFLFNVGAFQSEKNSVLDKTTEFNEVGFSYEVAKGLNLIGSYVESDATNDPKAFVVQIDYNWKSGMRKKMLYGWEKVVKPLVAHDQGISFSYFKVEPDSLPAYGEGKMKGFGLVGSDNFKGWTIGYQHMLEKNMLFYANYSDLQENVGAPKSDTKTVVGLELYY